MPRRHRKWPNFWNKVGQWLRNSDVWRRIGIGTIIAAILGGIAQAFGGDMYRRWLEPFFTKALLPLLESATTIQIWQIVIVGFFVVVLIVYSLALSATKDEDGRVTATMVTDLEKMSAPMLLALENNTQNATMAVDLIQQLMRAAIRRIRNSYGGRVFRGSVWVPDPDDPANWLRLLADIGLDDVGRSRRFYIGLDPDDESRKRGVAGEAYCTKIPQLAHYDKVRGKSDNSKFIRFTSDVEREYASFVAVPLSASFLNLDQGDQSTRNDNKVYGVICLDSAFRTTFNNDPIIDKEGKRLLAAGPLLRIIYHLLRWYARLTPRA